MDRSAVDRGPWTVGLLVASAMGATVACRQAAAEPPVRQTPRRHRPRARSEIRSAVVPRRTTLAALLEGHELFAEETAAIIASIGELFDLRRVRAGQLYRLDRFLDGRLREFEYEIDMDRRLIVRRQDDGTRFATELVPIEKTIERVTVTGAISRETPSLVEALEAAGERVDLSLALADFFSREMDLNGDLQPGESFQLIVERASRRDGVFGGYGPVLAAEIVNEGRQLRAVRFTPPAGQPGYYDENGRSLKRFFLKSPLKFEPRVTSSFSRGRRHPILDYTRAHNGVDYAAPPGAPIAAVSSGVVTLAWWTGGGGRIVRIRHASRYESEYLHLSSIARGVRRGIGLDQDDLVGRVGSSGLATGPHLHYGLRRNGAYVNPVREHQEMPPGDPVGTPKRK